MVLNGKRLAFCNDYFVAAASAPVNSRIWHVSAGRVRFIKLDMLGLDKEASVLIVGHDCSTLRLTTPHRNENSDAIAWVNYPSNCNMTDFGCVGNWTEVHRKQHEPTLDVGGKEKWANGPGAMRLSAQMRCMEWKIMWREYNFHGSAS